MEDKLIVVYEGSYAQYRGDWLKDEYVNKLVIVTGEQSSTSAEARKSYLCVSNGEKSVAIPIPSVYLQGIMVDGARYGYTDGYMRFAKANGIDLSFDVKTGDLSIGISEDLETTLSSLNVALTQVSTKADNAASKAETASQKANTANQTASSAKTTANEASTQVAEVAKGVAQNKAKIEAIEEDYISKGEAVDFATDLTGVVEATAEEFVYRPSAGEKSIRDKSAVIRRIKGNSVVWEQKLLPLTSDNWNQYSTTYANIAFADNAATLTLTAAYTGQNVYNIGLKYNPPTTQKYLSGHKYLVVGLCKLQSGGKLLIQMANQDFETNEISASPNKWVSFGAIGSLTNDSSKFYIKPPFSYASLREGSSYSVSNVMLFDLTAMFGEGNEPATVEEFRKVYNEAYYPYCQSELRGVKTGAIKTVGFNLFDGSCARVIGGMTYIVSNYAAAYYSETKNGAQTAVLIKEGVYTPECSGYLHLTDTADATPCVHFQHSGVMDDKCAPYEEHILNLPEILKLFPNGMHGLRNTYHDVYDEINIDNYIKRLEIVDLGSLWWNSDSSRQCFHAPLNTHKVRGIALCTRYTCSTLGSISDKQLSTHNYYGSARIFIKDADFDNPTDFMASLQGVYLVYELNEPIITPLTEPITWDYYCEDWGSEEAIPTSSASAPFRADIVYQFNAEGRIRDNSRNIEKLEKIVTPLKNIPSNASLATQGFVLSRIPTRVATATERVKMYEGQTQLLELLPNVMYDWTGGGSLLGSITIPPLYINTETIGTYDHQWMVRVGSDTSDKVTIPFDVLWKDGIAPNWTSWGICEITFKCDAQQDEAMRKIIGEWKIYK